MSQKEWLFYSIKLKRFFNIISPNKPTLVKTSLQKVDIGDIYNQKGQKKLKSDLISRLKWDQSFKPTTLNKVRVHKLAKYHVVLIMYLVM